MSYNEKLRRMIDDNKITEAFKMYNEKVENELAKRLTRKPTSAKRYADTTLRQCAFIAGVKWMQEEFLKDLQHPASEEPNHESIRTYILGKTKASESGVLPMLLRPNTNWKEFVVSHGVTHRLYVDDLFTKKGGEQ